MNILRFHYARAVASTGSFTVAADRCGVTRPTLAKAVAQLEEELGQRLFVRNARKVSLTPFGAHLLPYLTDVVKAQAQLMQQSVAFVHSHEQALRVGVSPLLDGRRLAGVTEEFRRTHPQAVLVLREMTSQALSRELHAGLLDVAIGVAGAVRGPLHRVLFYREPLLFLPARAQWPHSQGGGSVLLKDIADHARIVPPDTLGPSHATRVLFCRHRRKRNKRPGEALSYQVLEAWALLGISAAILPCSKVPTSADGALRIVNADGREETVGFEAAWPSRSAPDAMAAAFADRLTATAQEM